MAKGCHLPRLQTPSILLRRRLVIRNTCVLIAMQTPTYIPLNVLTASFLCAVKEGREGAIPTTYTPTTMQLVTDIADQSSEIRMHAAFVRFTTLTSSSMEAYSIPLQLTGQCHQLVHHKHQSHSSQKQRRRYTRQRHLPFYQYSGSSCRKSSMGILGDTRSLFPTRRGPVQPGRIDR